jgi:hypothetical protein
MTNILQGSSLQETGMALNAEKPSVDEWIVGHLREYGDRTVDELATSLPNVNWAQLFLAIDRLSRAGTIALMACGRGEYVLRTKVPLPVGESGSPEGRRA